MVTFEINQKFKSVNIKLEANFPSSQMEKRSKILKQHIDKFMKKLLDMKEDITKWQFTLMQDNKIERKDRISLCSTLDKYVKKYKLKYKGITKINV